MTKSKKKPDPYLVNDENPEWTDEMFARARPAREVLHEIFSKDGADKMLTKKPGRALGSGVKASQTIRFDVAILEAFKATGKGWQTRMTTRCGNG